MREAISRHPLTSTLIIAVVALLFGMAIVDITVPIFIGYERVPDSSLREAILKYVMATFILIGYITDLVLLSSAEASREEKLKKLLSWYFWVLFIVLVIGATVWMGLKDPRILEGLLRTPIG